MEVDVSAATEAKREALIQVLWNMIDKEYSICLYNKKMKALDAFVSACKVADLHLQQLIKASPQDKSFFISTGLRLKWQLEESFKIKAGV